MWNPVRYVVETIGRKNPLFLSHHPTCEFYDHHTITVYGYKLCMGCSIVYPTAFLSLLTLCVLRLLWPEFDLVTYSTTTFYIGGFALLGPMVITKLVPGTQPSELRIAAKFVLAIGLALLVFPFVFRPADRLLTLGLFFGFLIPYLIQKGVTARDDCQGCPEAADFPDCSGMEFDTDELSESERTD